MTIETRFIEMVAQHQGILLKLSSIYASDKPGRKDLMQEILFQLWKSFPKYDANRGVKISTWIYRVALNTALTYKRNIRRVVVTEDLLKYENTSEMQVDQVEPDEQRELLYTTIAQLEEIDRAIILLSLEGYNYEDIAEITGFNENNIGVKLNRIKKKIQSLIQDKQHGL